MKIINKNLSLIFKARLILYLLFLLVVLGCKKGVQISPPANSLTTSLVFADSADADASISGIYSNFIGVSTTFCNAAQTIYCGLSADELVNYNSDPQTSQFYLNALQATNGTLNIALWEASYTYIYQVNASIEGLQSSTSLNATTKNELIGECKFLRALFYFYMVNLYGDVPYINSSAWAQTATASRTPIAQVYQYIVEDLQDAQNLLRTDYSISPGQRTRANQWAATALLARVYLYTKDYTNAEKQASVIINNLNLFGLEPLGNVFSINSMEAILQWQLNTSRGDNNATVEGIDLNAPSSTLAPSYYISSQLLSAFDSGDNRKNIWIDNSKSGSPAITYYYPHKYKIGVSGKSYNAAATEYYTVLRLAEQFLIRAEAEANGAGGGINSAISDVNVIRNRAGLSDYAGVTDKDSVLNAIYHERQIEFFAEWGHRWFDLKRTGRIDEVMSVVTPQKNGGGTWNSYQQLYPIPQSELSLDPNLTQNSGY